MHFTSPNGELILSLKPCWRTCQQIGGIFPISASESKWAKLYSLSRSVTSNEPVLFRRPARYTRAYSRPKLLTVTPAMLGPSLPRGHMSLQKGRPSYDHQLQYRLGISAAALSLNLALVSAAFAQDAMS